MTTCGEGTQLHDERFLELIRTVTSMFCRLIPSALITLCLFAAVSEVAAQSTPGAVVSANPAATSAAAKILADGGSAADAAIAAQVVLGVVEPQSSGIGGGAVLLYRESADGPIRAFDGLTQSHSAYVSPGPFAGGKSHGGVAVGVPGALRLMELLHARYGKLPWANLFQPAIDIASNGFKVSPYLARSLAAAAKAGFTPPAWFLDGEGKPVGEGALVRNESLASALRRIAQDGPTAFYVDLAPDIVAAVRESSAPGALKAEDLQTYKAVEREPLCTSYRQMRLCAFPPPSYGGVAVLEILGLLDQLDAGTPNFLDARFIHLFIEAGRIAEADRADSVGDPDRHQISIAMLLDRNYQKRRARAIDPGQSMKEPIEGVTHSGSLAATCLASGTPPGPSTSEIAIADRFGAALSMTTTINVNFGSWITVDGFFLNNAMTNFTCAADEPEANKRPETSMTPIIAIDLSGHTRLIGGSAGGGEIVDYVAQAVLQLTHGAPPLEALDAGHVSTAPAPYSGSAGRVELEAGRSVASLADQLRKLGHDVRVVPLSSGLGFLERQNNTWLGAADPRRDGVWAVTK